MWVHSGVKGGRPFGNTRVKSEIKAGWHEAGPGKGIGEEGRTEFTRVEETGEGVWLVEST